MKTLLLGANGRTGREIIKCARNADDSVTALVPNIKKLSDISARGLTIHEGNVCDHSVISKLLPGHDVVISALGPGSPRKVPCTIYSKSAAAIVTAMELGEVKRLLVTADQWIWAMLHRVRAGSPAATRSNDFVIVTPGQPSGYSGFEIWEMLNYM